MIIEQNNKQIQVMIVNKNNKHTYFHFKSNHILVTKHKRVAEAQIIAYLEKHFDRFYDRINQVEIQPTYFGTFKALSFEAAKSFDYHIDNHIIIYHNKSEEDALKQFYVKELGLKIESLLPWLEQTIKKVNLDLRPMRVKWLKTKYGSCHIKKEEITINAFLAKLDITYLKYVLLHEYAHLIVPNHQKAFYQVLDRLMPGHKQIQRALKKYHIHLS